MATEHSDPHQRRLAAVLAADIAGYSRLMGADEDGTVRALKGHQAVILPMVAEAGGRVIDIAGDGVLSEFPSVIAAVQCALAIQQTMETRNDGVAAEKAMRFRIGVHSGDIIFDETRIYGDGINVAARLQALADPGGVMVSANVHDELRGRVEASFEDLGEHELKNIARPVRVYRWRQSAEAHLQNDSRYTGSALRLPDKPSIAVLPFQNMSGDPEQDYFADGVAEEITTALARIKSLFVAARNSAFTYKSRKVDVRQAGRDLGVKYLLEGSVRKGGNRIRISGQLIEASSGRHIWANKFDGSNEDVFELQDKVSEQVVTAIEPEIRSIELARSRRKRPDSLTAYDYYLQALSESWRTSRESNEAAIGHCMSSIELEPDYASPLALAAHCYHRQRNNGWAHSSAEAERLAVDWAERAILLDSEDPDVLWMAGSAIGTCGRQPARGRDLIDRSLELNQNSARAWAVSGWSHLYLSDANAGLRDLKRALRLSPRDPTNYFVFTGISGAYMVLKDYDQTLEWAHRAIQERSAFPTAWRCLAVANAYLGRKDQAAEAIRELLKLEPGLTVAMVAQHRTSFS